jgi:hypothetical protein
MKDYPVDRLTGRSGSFKNPETPAVSREAEEDWGRECPKLATESD